MEFIIKPPSYYEQHYELDKEIVDMSKDIENYMKDKFYSDAITLIQIFPVVGPPEILEQGLWKEWAKVSKSINMATVFKHIDYKSYMNGMIEKRKKLTIKCVLEAVPMIKKKSRLKFDVKEFEKDLLNFTGYSTEEINM